MSRRYMKFLFYRRRYKEDSLLIHRLFVTALTLLGPKRTLWPSKPNLLWSHCVSVKSTKNLIELWEHMNAIYMQGTPPTVDKRPGRVWPLDKCAIYRINTILKHRYNVFNLVHPNHIYKIHQCWRFSFIHPLRYILQSYELDLTVTEKTSQLLSSMVMPFLHLQIHLRQPSKKGERTSL